MRYFQHDLTEVTEDRVYVFTVPQLISTALVRTLGDVPVYIGSDKVCAPGDEQLREEGYKVGFPILPGETVTNLPTFDSDIIDLYAVTEKGKTARFFWLCSD